MNQVHDIDADGDLDGPPSTENLASPSSARANPSGRPDATSGMVPDPLLDQPTPAMNPRTMYICAGTVAFGLVVVGAGLLFGGGRSEPKRTSAAPVPVGYLAEQQRMAREAMSMAREAQQMQRERLDLMRQEMMNGDAGPGMSETATSETDSTED